jgi:hypothetical protein
MNKTSLSYCLCLISLLAGACTKDQVSLGHDNKPIKSGDGDTSAGDGDKSAGDGDKSVGDGDSRGGDGDKPAGDGDTSQPCAGLACGEACLPCSADDPKCGQSDVKYECNSNGACVEAGHDLCPSQDAGSLPGGDEGCKGKACGDGCTSGPTEVTTACNAQGQCVAKTEGMCTTSCKDTEAYYVPGCDPPTEVALLSSAGCYQPCTDKPCADPNLYCVQVWAHENCDPSIDGCTDSCGGLTKICMPD